MLIMTPFTNASSFPSREMAVDGAPDDIDQDCQTFPIKYGNDDVSE